MDLVIKVSLVRSLLFIYQGNEAIRHRPPECWTLTEYTRWCDDIETIAKSQVICEGNQPLNGGCPSQASYDVSLMLARTTSWTNSQVASDLRCHDTHCNVVRYITWNMHNVYCLCFAVLWLVILLISQGCFTGTRANIHQCLWQNHKGYP